MLSVVSLRKEQGVDVPDIVEGKEVSQERCAPGGRWLLEDDVVAVPQEVHPFRSQIDYSARPIERTSVPGRCRATSPSRCGATSHSVIVLIARDPRGAARTLDETGRTPKEWDGAPNSTPDSCSVGRRTTALLCLPLCPRQAKTHPKLPHASQTQKEKPLGKSATYRGARSPASACEASALPTELIVRAWEVTHLRDGRQPLHPRYARSSAIRPPAPRAALPEIPY